MPKISQFDSATTPLSGGETFILNQGGVTYNTSLSSIKNYTDTTVSILSTNWQNTYTNVAASSANWNSVYTSYQSASASYPILTDGKLNASVIPDELDVRLSVLKDSRLNLREAVAGNGELVIDDDTNEILVGDGSGNLFRGYQTPRLTFISTSNGGVSAYPFSQIPDGWQQNNTNIRGLIIGSEVTSIGEYAFTNTILSTNNLVIPDSVTIIGSYAFYGCGFQGSLIIPDSVTYIGNNAFGNLPSSTGSLVISNSLSSIPYGSFVSNFFTGPLVIPDSITSIGDYAFLGCQTFTGDLVIPDSVTSIGVGSFGACIGFDGSLILGNSLTSIGDYAFQNCWYVSGNLVIPDSVTSIGDNAFENCFTLSNIYANLSASSFPSSALTNTNTGYLFITAPFLSSYGGSGASWGSKTVSLWDSYPSLS